MRYGLTFLRSNQNEPDAWAPTSETASQMIVSAPCLGDRSRRRISFENPGSESATPGVAAQPGCIELTTVPLSLNVGAISSVRLTWARFVIAYAMTKRAQVSLTELIAPTFKESGTVVNSMHPGWAATPGVADSLPGFSKLMRRRLRSPKQGADTIIWLAVSEVGAQASGSFWFDRKKVSPYLIPGTQEDLEARTALVELCWAQL